MQVKFPDGSVMVCGGAAADGELKFVGADNKRVCKLGLAVGKRQDADGGTTPKTVWCNVTAWHGLAPILASACKGDSVLAIGRVKTHEYNGKTYAELNADYISVASVSDSTPAHASPPTSDFAPIDDENGDELPF